jgi:hypothetical protein
MIKEFNKNRFLIISRAGDHSLHKEWLKPIEYKNFDLCISYYGDIPGCYENECDLYFESKGTKWPEIKKIIQFLGDRINDYDAIWLPDDDIMTNAKNINHMFEIFLEQGFELAQPSLSRNSYFSHNITLQKRDYLWRYTPFVEIMVPIFSKIALKKCSHTFDYCQTGWGLDLIWPKILGYPYKKIAMIDMTPVYHTRPIGSGPLYNDLSPFDELKYIEKKYNVDWITYQSRHYDGVLQSKRMFVIILAHENEYLVEAQIENIRYFNPDAGIILYNGGKNKDFAKNLDVTIYPYSQRIHWAAQARVFWDVTRWLKHTNVDYEYLICFDHDMLFVKPGFEKFLDTAMKGIDCLGWQMLEGTDIENFPDSRVPTSLWREWRKWSPIFQTNNFLRYFNPGQVYRQKILQKMITFLESKISEKKLNRLFKKTKVHAFEEMFMVTLAMASGGKCREYPDGNLYNEAVRWGENITIAEVQNVIKNPNYYWIHPVKNNALTEMHRWLLNYYSS